MKFGSRGWVFNVYGVLLTDKCLRSFWGHSVHFQFLTTLYLETGRSQNETECNLSSGWVFSVYSVLSTVKCLRSFWDHWCISDGQQYCISKMAGRRAKRSEICPKGWVFSAYRILVNLNVSGNSGVIRCISESQLRCFWKMAGFRAKHTPKSLCYPVLCGHSLRSSHAEQQRPCASCSELFFFHRIAWQMSHVPVKKITKVSKQPGPHGIHA